MFILLCIVFFFFSSRRRHTRLTCDWSSDVCSSDLNHHTPETAGEPGEDSRSLCGGEPAFSCGRMRWRKFVGYASATRRRAFRSEERRVGKECRSRWSRYHYKKKNKVGKLRDM